MMNRKAKSGAKQLKKKDHSLREKEEKGAASMNNVFKNVDGNPGELPHTRDGNHGASVLKDIDISLEDVEKRLSRLDPYDETTGPDGIPAVIFNKCSSELAKPLHMLYRQSVNEGTVPTQWKQALVTPVFRIGRRNDAGIQPQVTTSVTGRVLESIVRDRLVSHFELNNVFTTHRRRGKSGKSCLTNLLEAFENWMSALDKGNDTFTVLEGYLPAFGSVCRQRLLRKLKLYGVQGNMLNWIDSFLSNRTLILCLDGENSDWSMFDSGLPQGSVLAPILFLVYINGMPDQVYSNATISPNDIIIWNCIKKITFQMLLLEDLDKLSDWSKDWLLKFHVGKCAQKK